VNDTVTAPMQHKHKHRDGDGQPLRERETRRERERALLGTTDHNGGSNRDGPDARATMATPLKTVAGAVS